MLVLNLVISGIPSILGEREPESFKNISSFKPCYKWNTFNTNRNNRRQIHNYVLNLVISGIPSILSVIVEFKNGLREF